MIKQGLRELRAKDSYTRDYVVNQLVHIAEANHKFKERIFDFLAEETECLSILVRMVVSG